MANFKNSKLIKTFQLLSAQERLLLKDWLRSPWCNSNKKLLQFYLLIAKPNTKFTSSRFNDESLFSKLFDKTFNKQLLSNLKTEFVRQIEDFLSHQQLRKEKDVQKKMLARSYFDKQEFDKYKKNALTIIKSKQDKPVKKWIDYLELTLLYESLYFLPTDKNNQKPAAKDLLAAEENLELFFALGQFRLAHGKIYDPILSKKESKVKDHLKQLRDLYKKIKHPAIELYYIKISRPSKWNYDHFLKFKLTLLQNFSLLSLKDQQILLFSAINDAVVLNSKKELRANQDIHELYDFGIKNKTLIFNNTITGTTFANIIFIAIGLAKYRYARKFIKDYIEKLPAAIQEEAICWANGQILYSEKKYQECIKSFKKIEKYHYPSFALTQRSTTLKALFDKEIASKRKKDFLEFELFCNSFGQYIRRINFLPKERIEAYLRFIQHSLKLRLIPYNEVNTEKEKIKKLLEKEENLFGKQWILAKLEEL